MKTCFTWHNIRLHQRGKDSFRVVYGLEAKDRLTYSQACAALGAAIMHSLACESKLDNRTKNET